MSSRFWGTISALDKVCAVALAGLVGIGVAYEFSKQPIEPQDPKAVIAEGYGLRDKLYAFVDGDKSRTLNIIEKRNLLDLLGFDKTILDESSPLTIKPTVNGDSRLNVYLSYGSDIYAGTVTYAQAEVMLKKKK